MFRGKRRKRMKRAMEVRMWVGWERRGGGRESEVSWEVVVEELELGSFPISRCRWLRSQELAQIEEPIINCSMDVGASRHLYRCYVSLPRRMMVTARKA